jgi:hypothetical protein
MRIVVQDDDETGFIHEVRACVSGIIRLNRPPELFLIKTNAWFGPKWLRFQGKVSGSFGVWAGERCKNVALPPFVPHRILWERRYLAPEYKQAPIRRIVHEQVSASRALKRNVRDITPNASLVWFSGSSRSNKRGAIMAYLLVEGSYWAWYLSWEQQNTWRVTESIGATADEIAEIRRWKGGTLPLRTPD